MATSPFNPTTLPTPPAAAEATLEFPKTLDIDMGKGNDTVELKQVLVRGDLKMKTGQGSDTLSLTASDVLGNTKIDIGGKKGEIDGLDTLIIQGSGFGGKFDAKLGEANDTLSLYFSKFLGKFKADGGNGWDKVEYSSSGLVRRGGISPPRPLFALHGA